MTNIVEQARAVQHPACKPLVNELANEIERLKADLATYVNNTETTENRIIDAEFAAQELRADNERLRAALQEIADFPYVGTQASQKIWGIARRALETKP